MGNCLKTQLKEVVNNDNLVTLNTLRFLVKQLSNPTNNTQTFRIVGSPIEVPESYPMTDSEHLANGNYDVTLSNKYDITQITCADAAALKGSIAEFKYITGLQRLIYINNSNNETLVNRKYGDLSDLSALTNLVALFLSNTAVSGDISNLGAMKKCKNISLPSSVSGSIEGFVAKRCLAGATQDSIQLIIPNKSDVTFGYENLAAFYRLVWESNTRIAYYNNEIINATTVAVMGYTEQEIIANRAGTGSLDWSGKTVIDVSTNPPTVYS